MGKQNSGKVKERDNRAAKGMREGHVTHWI